MATYRSDGRRLNAKLNDLALPDDLGLAYLAGVIDGDGSIVNHDNGQGVWYQHVIVTNTSKELIEYLSKIGGHIRETNMSSNKLGKLQGYRWVVYRVREVEALLIGVIPYLIVKRKRAEEALAALGIRLKV